MQQNVSDNFAPVLDDLLATIRSGWLWPSPDVGFLGHIYSSVSEPMPIQMDVRGWPSVERLDDAPVLASTGYLLGERDQVMRSEWQRQWAAGFDRLSEREPFRHDRMTFAYRPTYVLGIAIGSAHCPLLSDTGRGWLRAVLQRLQHDSLQDEWADLIYGLAARAVGATWRDRYVIHVDQAPSEALALVRWIATASSATAQAQRLDVALLDAELIKRVSTGVNLPRDVARAGVIHRGLQAALARTEDEPRSEPDTNVLVGEAMSVLGSKWKEGSTSGAPTIYLTLVKGNQLMGDSFQFGGDNIGGAVGRGASVVARDISVFKDAVQNSPRLDDDLKSKLATAREAIETTNLTDADKQDVVESLRRLVEELDRTEKNTGIIKRFWNRIDEVAPTISSIVASAASISAMIHGQSYSEKIGPALI